MIGDKLIIETFHTETAKRIVEAIKDKVKIGGKHTISVSGESGSGKSELAAEIKKFLTKEGLRVGILQQDDYFIYPSKKCHEMRVKNIDQVGSSEAKLDLMDANLFAFKNWDEKIYKALSIYDENRSTTEIMKVGHLDVLIAEGTYCAMLNYVDTKVFINRDYKDSKKKREQRARDVMGDFIERVLEIEHAIVKEHKALADIVVTRDWSGIEVRKRTEAEGPYREIDGLKT